MNTYNQTAYQRTCCNALYKNQSITTHAILHRLAAMSVSTNKFVTNENKRS